MTRKTSVLTAAIIILLSSSLMAAPKINQYLLNVMQSTNDNTLLPIYITFNNNLTLQDFDYIPYDTPKDLRRKIVVDRLITRANNSQARVLSLIQQRTSQAQY